MSVTDWSNESLTLLNSNTVNVTRKHRVEGKALGGVTSDPAGDIYVCYWTNKVAVLSRDFSEENTLLTQGNGYKRESLSNCL